MTAALSHLGVETTYHPSARCSRCGVHVLRAQLRVALIHSTRARGLLCVDAGACERRLYRRRLREAA